MISRQVRKSLDKFICTAWGLALLIHRPRKDSVNDILTEVAERRHCQGGEMNAASRAKSLGID